jgi:hypothetical protein
VEEGDLEVMQQQQTQALASYKRDESRGNVEVVAPGYFWAQLNALV